MICRQILYSKQFLNEPEFICLHTVKWFQVLLSNTDSFIYTQLNGFKQVQIPVILCSLLGKA